MGPKTKINNMENFCFDIDYYQARKHGQNVCGDSFLCSRTPDGRIIAVLSDGLGSGIKANILSSMTAKMALKFVDAGWDVKKYCDVISSVLPICNERHLNYSTFTIADIDAKGSAKILEQGNPHFIFVRNGRVIEPTAHQYEERQNSFVITTTSFSLMRGDRIIFFSDGVTQAGIGSAEEPNGWGRHGVVDFTLKLLELNPEMASLKLCQGIIRHAQQKDGDGNPKDDITCCSLYLRTPRRLMVFSGPPYHKELDGQYAKTLDKFDGKKVVCGGTTAKIAARELGREVRVDTENSSSRFGPPLSIIDGIDLVTEGVLTLTQVSAALEAHTPPPGFGGAAKLYALLLSNDYIEFIVGTRLNEAHQDPAFPRQLAIRRNVIDNMIRILRDKYFKDVKVSFV